MELCFDAAIWWAGAGKPTLPLASLRIGYIQKEFEGAPNNPDPTEAQRQASSGRNAMYAEALDVFRKLGAKLEPMAMPDFPTARLASC